jgi:hypothetical protein
MASNWITLRSANPSVVIPSALSGNYEIEVTAIDAFGNRSVAANSQQTINRSGNGALDAQGASIEAVEGAAATALSATIALLSWTPPRTAGLSVAIRHTPSATGGAWDTGSPVTLESPLASDGQAQVPALSGCYLLRFVNDSGTGSFLIAVAPFSQSPTPPFTYAANYLESVGNFAGTKSNCYYDASIGALRVNRDGSGGIAVDTRRVDDLTGNWDSLTGNIDDYGVDGRIAIYSFSNVLDLGTIKDVELIRTIKSYSLGAPVLWDSIVGNIDDATFDFEGKFSDGGEVFIEYSSSSQAPSSTTKWSEWAPLTHCYALLRSLRLRARLIIGDVNQDLAVTELGAAVLLAEDAGSTATTRTTKTHTTASLAQFGVADFTMDPGKLSELVAIEVSEPSWVRIYRSSAQRSADTRTVPGGALQTMIDLGDSKPYSENVTTTAGQIIIQNPVPMLQGDSLGLVYIRLIKQSAGSSAVTLTITIFPQET